MCTLYLVFGSVFSNYIIVMETLLTFGIHVCLGANDPPKKVQKKQYAKANITNSADKLIRQELDGADGTLEKVI